MQQIIVYIIVTSALIYLGYRFLGNKKHESCDKCDLSKQTEEK